MGLKRILLLSCATTGAFLGTSTIALAQDSDSSGLSEIVVTAEKREQSIQDVPVAVSAYSAKARDELGIITVEDFARFTPSVTYTNNDRMSIRGFGRLTNAIGSDPAVALYSDGIFSNSMAPASVTPIFIQRTEILRGPQGTLYGRNSIGGAINVISRHPTDEFEAELRGGVSNYGGHQIEGLVTGPISESWRYLIGGSYVGRSEGFIHNQGTADDTADLARSYLEGQIEGDLWSGATARLRVFSARWDDNYGVGNVLGNTVSPYNTTAITAPGDASGYYNFTYTGVNNGLVDGVANPGVTDPYQQWTNRDAISTLNDHIAANLEFTWDLGGVTLKYLGGYQTYVYTTTGGDYDGTSRTSLFNVSVPDPDGAGPLPAYTAFNVSPDADGFYLEDQSWYSNEINLSSNGDGPVHWIVGLYQYHQDYAQEQGIRVYGDNALAAPISFSGLAVPLNLNRNIVYVGGDLTSDSYAAFGQVDWEFAPTWTVTLGLRYTDDEKSGFDSARYVARNPTIAYGLMQAGYPALTAQGAAADVTVSVACPSATATYTVLDCAANPLTADIVADPRGGLRRNLDGSWDALTGTFGVQWEPTTDTNFYARYGRGYKSGGWLGGSGLVSPPYAEPEHVDNYELGAKFTLFDQLQINAAAYYANYEGFQAPLTVLRASGQTGTQFLNLNAHNKGFELETIWAPTQDLQLFANYAYMDTRITRGCCFADSTDPFALAVGAHPADLVGTNEVEQSLVGNPLPLSPENKATVGGSYTWETGIGSITATTSYTWVDEQQTTVFENPLRGIDAYELVNFRVLFTDPDQRFTLIGYVNNALDEQAYQSSTGTSVSATGIQGLLGPQSSRQVVTLNFPRVFGVELQYKF